MKWVQNNVPFILILHMFTAGVLFFIVGVLLIIKYYQRQKPALRYLIASMFSLSISELILATLVILDYLGIEIHKGTINTYFGIFFWYILLALSNAFFVGFITTVFVDDNNQVLIVVTALNAISIGLFLPNISFENILYTKLKAYVLYFIVISILTYSVVIIQSIKSIKENPNRIIKVGYTNILLYEIIITLSFIFHAFSLRQAFYSGNPYNMYVFFTHGLYMIASFLAYLGFVYPDWLKRLVEQEGK